ncbi:MAG TPA: prepilin peptidase [Devosiaceae bacterium]|jgi:prepilin peptidase CpaA|nr:prepilin peptidase [Devosiaceae bacterium]
MTISTIALLIFPLLMAFAAASDLLTMRISNRLVLLLVAAFLPVALFAGLPLQQLAMHAAFAGLVLVVAFAFFAFGWIGGGDAKFAAATALWLGNEVLLPYLVYAGLLGGALTFAVLLLRRVPLTPQIAGAAWLARLHDSKAGVPYGIALAAAGLAVYTQADIYVRIAA